MLSTSGVVPRLGSQITANSYNFANNVSLEIKRRVTLVNRCYFGLHKHLSSTDLSHATKLTLYNAAAFGMFERKVMRKIWCSKSWRWLPNRTNQELYELFNKDAHLRRVFDAEVGGRDDRVRVEKTRLKRPWLRSLWPTGVRALKVEAPGKKNFKPGRNSIIGLLWPHK